ncbi:MAG: Stp1/IreP family PP2C-type Ser/Thr phosphatase [Anaerolineae bacterium]|nr:Stp1/IreP family PP2C-type Ser/Thr phosphatase [Anaerolineae bacterium]
MPHPEQGIRLRSSARTSVGQVRENNEDNIHLWPGDDFVLAIVADGMGGAAAGEEASRLAVEAIRSGFSPREVPAEVRPTTPEDATLTDKLRDAIQDANLRIFEKASTSPEMRGMGTTVTLAFVRGTHAIVAHVGDSRAYLVDGEDGNITQITADHSFVRALLDAGHITEEQAEEHPMRNVLYRALGQADDIDVDLYFKRLHIGDRLVLCSDGLTRHVKPSEIARLALSDPNPDVASQKLIDLANERGGEDNVSVIVVSVEATRPAPPAQQVAQIADLDDDKTLLLKDRQSRLMTTLTDLEIDDRETVETQRPPLPLDSSKMDAERLKDVMDDDDIEDITEDSPPFRMENGLDRAIARRADALPQPISAPVLEAHETQAEGRDNLIPDQ